MAQIIRTVNSVIHSISTISNFVDSPIGHTIRTGCSLGYAAGAGALTSMIIRSSIGASGGAIFGVTSWLVGRGVSWISNKALDAMNLAENTTAKIAAFFLKFFMTTGACMWAAMLAGFPITFTAATLLNLASSVVLPAITVTVIIATVAPWIISLVHWAQTRTVNVQEIINRFVPAQDNINAGANFINNEVLANVSPETLRLFAEMDPSIFQFLSTKAIFIYSVGPRRNEEIPDYFQETTKESIRVLRQQLNDGGIIAQTEPFITDLVPFNGDGPQLPEVRAYFNRLRNTGSQETQGISLLNTRCYQRALELVPR